MYNFTIIILKFIYVFVDKPRLAWTGIARNNDTFWIKMLKLYTGETGVIMWNIELGYFLVL